MNGWIWVAVGGGLGALARYGVSSLLPPASVPWDVLLINFSGSLCIGIIMALVVEFGWLSPQFRLFWGVGVMGGYTTFSTYVLGIYLLAQKGAFWTAYIYGVGSLLLGLVGAWMGVLLARLGVSHLAHPPDILEKEEEDREPMKS
jgi:CrcB protein